MFLTRQQPMSAMSKADLALALPNVRLVPIADLAHPLGLRESQRGGDRGAPYSSSLHWRAATLAMDTSHWLSQNDAMLMALPNAATWWSWSRDD